MPTLGRKKENSRAQTHMKQREERHGACHRESLTDSWLSPGLALLVQAHFVWASWNFWRKPWSLGSCEKKWLCPLSSDLSSYIKKQQISILKEQWSSVTLSSWQKIWSLESILSPHPILRYSQKRRQSSQFSYKNHVLNKQTSKTTTIMESFELGVHVNYSIPMTENVATEKRGFL